MVDYEMRIEKTGRFSVIIIVKCSQCKHAEFPRGTGWPTARGEICRGCFNDASAIERLAGIHPVNQHRK